MPSLFKDVSSSFVEYLAEELIQRGLLLVRGFVELREISNGRLDNQLPFYAEFACDGVVVK